MAKSFSQILSLLKSAVAPEPYQVVVAVFLLVIFSVFVLRLSQPEGQGVEVDVKYRSAGADAKLINQEIMRQNLSTGEYDPHLRYAERIREASAIALGFSLFLLRERVEDRKLTVSISEALKKFSAHDLRPPQSEVLLPTSTVPYGLMRTARGLYLLRYNPKPFVLEVFACGENGLRDGAFFMLRVPDTNPAALIGADSAQTVNWAVLYVAPQSEGAWIPPAFAPKEQYFNSGWQIEALQAADVPQSRLVELQQFLHEKK